MNEARLASALERCLQAIREGWSPEGALRLYPALRPELDGLLQTSLRLTDAEAVLLPAASHAAIRAGIMNTARQAPPARTTTWDLRGWSWRTLAAPFAAVVLAFAVFLSFASVRETEAPTSQTVLTILGGEVQVETARGLVPGVDGMTVGSGDRIVTPAGARAVLTFFDGSTVVIEPGSDVTVTGVEVEEGELRAALAQMNGSTWTHIPQSLSEAEVDFDESGSHGLVHSTSVGSLASFEKNRIYFVRV